MVKKILGILVLMILVVPVVLALGTTITIKSRPNYEVTIRALDVGGKGTLEGGEFLDMIADGDGEVSVIYSSGTVDKIDLSVMQRNNGLLMKFGDGSGVKRFEDLKTGWGYYIDLTVNNPVVVKTNKTEEVAGGANETIDAETGKDETEEKKEDDKMTGSAVGDEKSGITSQTIYLIIALVFVLGALVFLILKAKKQFKSKKGSGYVDFKIKPESAEPKIDARILDVDEKIKTAAKELDEIMGKKED